MLKNRVNQRTEGGGLRKNHDHSKEGNNDDHREQPPLLSHTHESDDLSEDQKLTHNIMITEWPAKRE